MEEMVGIEAKTKRCIKCGKIMELNKFHKDKVRKDGLSCYCRECSKDISKYYRSRIKNGYIKEPYIKACPNCGERDLSKFHKNSRTRDGLQNYCIKCSVDLYRENNNKQRKEWNLLHPEEAKENRKRRSLKSRCQRPTN